jgi:TetR/AcrR family transcriptional regulator, transcriptional repressor for nem operon
MPYPAGHRDKIRAKIVEAARALFNRNGFESVSVNRIMAEAGLTRGGFYGYFKSKADLYIEVLSCFFTDPNWKNTWEGVEIDLDAVQLGPQVVRAYLSRQHFDDIEGSCPMIALPSDVARAERKTKQAFEGVFGAMVGFLERDVRNQNGPALATAKGIAALCIGGMVVARAMDDRGAAENCGKHAWKLHSGSADGDSCDRIANSEAILSASVARQCSPTSDECGWSPGKKILLERGQKTTGCK